MGGYWAPVLGAVLGISVTAAAAQTEEVKVSQAEQTVPIVDEGAVSAALGAGVEDILVTARRRVESSQHVPIALTAVSGGYLESAGVSNLRQFDQQVPSLRVLNINPRNTNFTVRGLGNNLAIANDGLESGVGVYVDDVFYGRPGLATFDIVDLDRIEVLRGPQGTLFGKNTTAGALNITTKKPSFTPEYSGEVSAGNYGYYQLRGSAAGPIVPDKLAFRINGAFTKRNGFIENVRNGQDYGDYKNYTAKAQFLFTPSDDLKVLFSGDYGHQDTLCCIQVLTGEISTLANGAPFPNNFSTRLARFPDYTRLPYNPFARKTDADSLQRIAMEQGGGSVEATWEKFGHTLTSITAYRFWNWNPRNDVDYLGLPIMLQANIDDHQQQFSQEFRIASPSDQRVEYVLGLFYFWQRVEGVSATEYGPAAAAWILPPATFGLVGSAALDGFSSRVRQNALTDSYAAFGQATWHVTDKLGLTGGLRYTYEHKAGLFSQIQQGGAPLSSFPLAAQAAAAGTRNSFAPLLQYYQTANDSNVSGQFTASYQATDTILAYATYARGYKSGGLNLAALAPGIPIVVEPEHVDNYEVGVKTTLFDKKVVFNAAAFWTEDSNYQASLVDLVRTVTYISNVGKVRSRGFEADVRANPIEGLSLYASTAFTEASYVKYPSSPCPIELFSLATSCDLSGRPLPGAPRWGVSVGGEYGVSVFETPKAPVEAYIGGDYSYRSSNYTQAELSQYSRVDGYGLTNLRGGIRSADGTWDVSLWARNVFNVDWYISRGFAPFNSGGLIGLLGEPRTFGATARFKY